MRPRTRRVRYDMHAPVSKARTKHMHKERFLDRHIGPREADVAAMLRIVGAPSLDALIAETIPSDIRQDHPLDFGPPLSEAELLEKMRAVASRNTILTSLIGQGCYGTHLPPVIQRNVLENPAWYTAYTPYQPEISQGRLEALLNFQTVVADLTGLPIAGASLLDEATAAAEAMTLCRRVGKSTSPHFIVDAGCHPQTRAVVAARAEPLGIELIVAELGEGADLDALLGDAFGVLVASPTTLG